MNPHYLMMYAAIGLTASAQLLLKAGVRRQGWRDPLTVLGLVVFLLVTLMNVYALQQVPMATLAAWTGATYPLVVCGAWLFLREEVRPTQVLGSCLIGFGIAGFILV